MSKLFKNPSTTPAPDEASAARFDFSSFLNNKERSDASFVTSDGVPFAVHQLILIGAKSREFKKIIDMMNEQQEKVYTFTEIDSETMKEVLKFVYTGSAELKDVSLAQKVYKAAKHFDLLDLQQQCIEALVKQVNLNTVLGVFEFAYDLKLKEVKQECLECILL